MTDVAIFMQHGWAGDSNSNASSLLDFTLHLENSQKHKDDQKKSKQESKESIFGLRALYDLKHQITVAPLCRFFQFALHQPAGDNKIAAIEQFHQSVRATVAFSFLWRGAWGGTSGIDGHYRNIMSDRVGLWSLARRPNTEAEDPCIQRYRDSFIEILGKEGINQKDEWVKKASTIPIYHLNKTVARFLLFCAMDDAAEFPGSEGKIKRGKQGSYPLLGIDHWDDDRHLTLEHIAPQKPPEVKGDWEADIYQDKDTTINLLGNLTLLPAVENSKISNVSWEEKLKHYKSLSNSKHNSGSTKYLKFCSDIAAYECWSYEIIKNRSENLAELAWDRLVPWLGLDSEF